MPHLSRNQLVRGVIRMASSRMIYRSSAERRAARLAQSREKNRILRDKRHSRGLDRHRVEVDDRPPQYVLDARDALIAPLSLTAAFFGDPLPGCSALDQRGGRV